MRVGNLVGQDGPTLLTTVSQVDPIRVNFPVSEIDYIRNPDRFKKLEERDLAWAKKQFPRFDSGGTAEGGDPGIELVLADGSRLPAPGVIVAVNRQIDASTGTIQLQALVPNPDEPAAAGAVRARAHPRGSDAGRTCSSCPRRRSSTCRAPTRSRVVGPDNKVQLRKVELGPSVGRVCASSRRASPRAIASSSTACRRSPTARSSIRARRRTRPGARPRD